MLGGGEPVRDRPGLGDLAPDFSARSTKGPVRLSERRGRWVLLFTHPADFTSVCTSELIAFAKAQPEFDAANCDLIGHSVDSLPSHIAWVRAIAEHTGLSVDFPLLEDVGLTIARAYGMIHDGSKSTATVRGVFIIDPEGYIQAVQFYPMTVGRNVAELLRLVLALQDAGASGANTPEGWQPGHPLLAPLESMPEYDDIPLNESSRSEGENDLWFMRHLE
jgi:peroxiredoxin 2/4